MPKLKSLPHSFETEQCLLGCILLPDASNEDMLDEIFNKIKKDDFYSTENANTFNILNTLFIKGIQIEFSTVINELDKIGNSPNLNNLQYLTNLMQCVPSNANYKNYINILKEKSKLRNIISNSQKVIEAVNQNKEAKDIMGEVEDILTELISAEEFDNKVESIEDTADNEYLKLTKKANGEYDEFGIPTGYAQVDKTTYGFKKGNMVVIGARPGVGKTAMALNIIIENCARRKNTVLFNSLEMTKSEIMNRLFAITTKIDNYTLLSGIGLKEHLDELKKQKDDIRKWKLIIDDRPNSTLPLMFNKAKKLKKKGKLDLMVIDYLQLINPVKSSGNRWLDVGEVARGIKIMARQLDIPIIVLCQLKRDVDNSERRPNLSDLKESGEIEASADFVALLNSKTKYDNAEVKDVEFIIAKHRNGALKSIPFKYFGSIFTFREVLADGNISEPKPREQAKKMVQQELVPLTKEEEGDLPF
jgi:replicative DNA helicase